MSRPSAAFVGLVAALTLAGGCGRRKPAGGDAAADAPRPDSGPQEVAPEAAREASGDTPIEDDAGVADAMEAGDAATNVADAASVDATDAEPADGAFRSGPHPALPQIRNHGGPVIAHPVLTAITYAGFDLRETAEEVVAQIGGSDYWTAATLEYGVGPATARPPIRLAETAPATIDDFQIQTWLSSRLDGTHPEFGTPTESSIYVVYFPTGTTVTNATLASCVAFGGYHASVWIPQGGPSGTNVAYAVVPECEGKTGTKLSLEGSTSHQLVEAATDPFGTTNSPGIAWSDVDDDHLVWQALLGGGEVTDLCQLLYSSVIIPFPYAHAVQRSWSNAAARAGHDPCAPAYPGEVYFSAAGVLPDAVTFRWGGVDRTTKGVRIAVGESRTIDVQLWSDAPPVLGPWTVKVNDVTPLLGGPADSLAFAWGSEGTTGTNGTTLRLTITVLKAAGNARGQAFMLTSDAGPRHEWFGFVGQP